VLATPLFESGRDAEIDGRARDFSADACHLHVYVVDTDALYSASGPSGATSIETTAGVKADG